MPHRDLFASTLAQLSIPEPRSNAVHAIMEAAKAEKRRKVGLFDPLRRLRAQLYIPSIRYGVMASVFGAFILIGGINRLTQEPSASPAAAPAQQAELKQERVPITADNLPNEILLYDVEFNDSDLLEGLWEV